MINYVDPLSMNSTTNLEDYNCGGFALRTLDWENMNSFEMHPDNIEDAFDKCALEIKKLFPEYVKIPTYEGVSNSIEVVGFRLAYVFLESDNQHYCDDFHFILRSHGIWYHKPGSNEIREVDFSIDAPWPHGCTPYNSEILWLQRV